MRIAAALLLACVACVSGDAHDCLGTDGITLLCPANTTCRTVGGAAVCATPDQLASCAMGAEGAPCPDGVCHEQTCVPVVCGDGRVDPPEQCDTARGEPCSTDCTSDLTCGNGVVDTAEGEECDDGNTDSHDGCDSRCRPEFPRWTTVTPDLPSARVNAAMAYDAVRGNVVMFGGQLADQGAVLGDTWIRAQHAWRRVQPLSTPAPRARHAMAYDGKTRRVYLYGGQNQVGPLADLWAWDGSSWHYVSPPGLVPPRLTGAAMAYDAHRQVLVLVGGATGTGTLLATVTDTWEFDGVQWTKTAALPTPRMNHALAYDPTMQRVVLFGGTPTAADKVQLADTLVYDGIAWVDLKPKTPPLERERAQLGFDGNHLVLTGGSKATDTNGSDATIYGWDVPTGDWKTISMLGPQIWGAGIAFEPGALVMFGGDFIPRGIVGPMPGSAMVTNITHEWKSPTWFEIGQPTLAVARAGAVLDLDLARAVLFGGVGSSQLFELIDGVWSDPDAASPPLGLTPSPRAGACAAYDEARATLVMFGGATAGASDAASTYTWTGPTGLAPSIGPIWALAATTGPSARHDHAMAYDASRNLTVLFGGRPPSGPDGQTWTWDGAAWTLVPATAGDPAARYGHGLAYDRVHQQLVMFGGRFVDGTATNETWLLSGTGWRKVDAPTDGTPWPSARVGAAVAWSPSRRRVVMVGGQSGILEQDTWEWDGRAWTQLPIPPPPPRTSGVLVGTSDGLVLTGGLAEYEVSPTTIAVPLADVWLLRYEGAQAGSSCRDDGDDDGDGFAGCDDPDCWLACHPACLPGDACVAALPHCGDMLCHGIETADLCPLDGCSQPGTCGNGACEPTGDCPGDCP